MDFVCIPASRIGLTNPLPRAKIRKNDKNYKKPQINFKKNEKIYPVITRYRRNKHEIDDQLRRK